MKASTERHYARRADIELGVYKDVHIGRNDIVMSEGATGRAWLKFNPGKQLIYVDDAEGRPRGLTPKQYAVLVAVFDIIRDGTHPTMTAVAGRLEFSVSTISRAMTKLAAWGLIRYIVGRGRYAGMLIFRAMPNDGLDRLRAVAKAKLRRWYLAAQARVSRSIVNVAPREPLNKVVGITTTNVVGATLKWTVDDLREAGIL